MALSDEIREQQAKLKELSTGDKIKYIWDYYKVHFIVAIALIIIASSLIKDVIANHRPEFINVMVLNTTYDINAFDDGIEARTAQYAGIDTKTTQLNFDTTTDYQGSDSADSSSMAVNLKILAQFQAKTLDVMIAPEEVILEYATSGGYSNLLEYFTQEELDRLAEQGYPILTADVNGTKEPIGISLKNSPFLKSLPEGYPYGENTEPYFTMALGLPHPESAKTFLQMLTE